MSLPDATGDERWDHALLAAGFEVDPDAALTGRAADEAAAARAADGDDLLSQANDPWAATPIDAPTLTDDQRSYVVTANPALGAALPAQSLTGEAPFGDVSDSARADADADIIDFD